MPREHSAKKLSLITVLAMLFLFIIISIVMAVQLPSKPVESNSTSDVKLLAKSLNTDHNYNRILQEILGSAQSTTQTWNRLSSVMGVSTISKVTSNTVGQGVSQMVTEENAAISIKPSSEIEVQEVRTDGSVSRGASPTYTVSNPSLNDNATFWQTRKTWLQPVEGRQTANPTGGARYFGASRANGRAHAAIDFIAPNGTLVYAMTDGKVIRTSLFFQNTSAVEVQNTDGTIARYCEIAPAVSVGTVVHRGDVIGKIITNNGGTSMLHLEMYMGTASGSLSQSNNTSNYKYVTIRNYERRSDLIDPTGAIYLPIK